MVGESRSKEHDFLQSKPSISERSRRITELRVALFVRKMVKGGDVDNDVSGGTFTEKFEGLTFIEDGESKPQSQFSLFFISYICTLVTLVRLHSSS